VSVERTAGEFPVTHCPTCDRGVLCYLDLDERELEVVRCVECSTPADADDLRWLDLAGIEELGYAVVAPDAGCGRPDCGRGRCGRGGRS